jgi:hypothetical protein
MWKEISPDPSVSGCSSRPGVAICCLGLHNGGTVLRKKLTSSSRGKCPHISKLSDAGLRLMARYGRHRATSVCDLRGGELHERLHGYVVPTVMGVVEVKRFLGLCILVERPGVPGIRRVGGAEGRRLRFGRFGSVAPVARSCWLLTGERRYASLPNQRVYLQNLGTGKRGAGRVIRGKSMRYLVRLPSSGFDAEVSERQLRVRRDRPIAVPIDVLAQESLFFHDARLPMLQSLAANTSRVHLRRDGFTIDDFPHATIRISAQATLQCRADCAGSGGAML